MAPMFVPFTLPQAIFNKLLSFPFVRFLVVKRVSHGGFIVSNPARLHLMNRETMERYEMPVDKYTSTGLRS